MAVSCGGSVIKILLFVFNTVWVLCGAGIIYLGVRIILKYNSDITDVIKETPSHSAIVLLSSGGLIFIIAFFGCCGAIKESPTMLNIYGGLIFICLAAQGVGAYMAIKYNYDLEKYANDGIKASLEAYNWHKSDTEAGNRPISELQKQLECCGVVSKNDWDISRPPDFQGKYPASCCQKSADTQDGKCPSSKTWDKGCVRAMIDYIKLYVGSIGYLAIGIVLVELLVLISACCLSRDIKSRYAPYAAPKGRG